MPSLGFSIGPVLGRVCSAVVFLFLVGCVNQPRIDWNSRVGTYTHDQAILEMGPPDRSATLTDGSKVAEWLVARGRVYGFADVGGPGFDRYPAYYGGPVIRHYSASTMPDQYLRLTFTPEGRLQSWGRVAR